MYGLVNRALEEMVTAEHGVATWEAIRSASGVDETQFNAMTQYPDSVTVALVGAASGHLKVSPSAFLRDLGAFWIRYTARQGYGDLLALGGSSFPAFLQNLDAMHGRIGLSFPELRPPSFQCTDITERSLTFHYFSEREGLSDLVIGLIEGLGHLFTLQVTIRPLALKAHGADHDTFHVTYAAL